MKHLKFLTILLSLIQPIAIIFFFGLGFKSFSKLCSTFLEPLFLLVNLLVIYCFLQHERWRIPALFLLLLTCFSTAVYSSFHNIFAVIFFLSCIYSLCEFKRMRVYIIVYSFSIVIGLLFGLFWFEFYAVYVLCIYHIHLFKIKDIYENRHDN